MKTSTRLLTCILILLLQACTPIIRFNKQYYIPHGEGELVSNDLMNYLLMTIGGKVRIDAYLFPNCVADYGSGTPPGILLHVIFRVPEGTHIKLTSGQFIFESKSLDAPVSVKAQVLESDSYGSNKQRKYKITDELPGYTVIIGKLFKQTMHAFYSASIPTEQHDLSIVTVKFPDIEINGQIHHIAPVRFERHVGTFWSIPEAIM